MAAEPAQGVTAELSKEKVMKAIRALLKHIEDRQSQTNLLEEDETIYLVIALTRIPQQRRKDKPIRLHIPCPLYEFEGAEICLFVKDKKGEGHKEGKQKVRQQKLGSIKKVIGISKLRTKYEAPEAKRQLCSQYDLFLADSRILPSLPKLIGKTFFKKKKQPIPLDLQKNNWGLEVKKAAEATYMFLPTGSNISIRVARSSFTPEQCVENVMAVLDGAVKHIPNSWEGVRSVLLKSAESVALPVYQRIPSSEKSITE